MKDCVVSLESPFSFIFVLLCFLSSFVYTVNGSGAYTYTNVFRVARRNHTGPQPPGAISDFGTHVQLPPIRENPHLEELDEEFSKCNGIDIREITILELQEHFANNRLTSVQLTNCYIERIEKMNTVLKAVIEINPEAIAQALQADLERSAGIGDLGTMHGIPVLIKENIATNDLMETTAGSPALAGIRPREDADVMKTLRKSGAVILGKANLSEFAYFRGTNIPSGWSGRGGYTRNAYNLNESPEGSSSGSAVAVSANLVTVSIGTETDGSLIAPSSIAGICTIKPTLGTPSTKGVIPISHHQDTVGPMARTVTDLAILLDAIIPEEDKRVDSYAQYILHKEPVDKFRIGVLRHPFWNISAINSTNLEYQLPQLEQIVESMKNSNSFAVMDPVAPTPEDIIRNVSATKEFLVLKHDFKYDFNEYLRNEVISPYPAPTSKSLHHNRYFKDEPQRRIACLKDVIQFNEQNPNPDGYNQELLIMSEATDGLRNETYREAFFSNTRAARLLLHSVLETYHLDAIVTPSESRYDGMIDETLQDSPGQGYSIAAIAGYPSVNIPAGIGLKGVPFGITLIGKPHTEEKLLKVAYNVEQMNPLRKQPQFLI